MSVVNGIITSAVDPADVASVLREPSYDYGTLCTSTKINIWSATKPVRHSSVGVVTLSSDTSAQRLAKIKTGNQTIMSESGYGLTWNKTMATALSGIPGLFSGGNNMNYWEYARPRGLQYKEGYRIGDFVGYNHNANPPVENVSVSAKMSNQPNMYGVISFASLVDSDSERTYAYGRNVQLADLKMSDGTYLSTWHPCVLMHKVGNTTNLFAVAASGTFADTSQVQFPSNALASTGQYKVYLCASKTSFDISASLTSTARFASLPLVGVMETEVVSTTISYVLNWTRLPFMLGVSTTISGTVNVSGTTMRITNSGSSTWSAASGNYVYVRVTGSSTNLKAADGTTQWSLGSISVSSSSTKDVTIPPITLATSPTLPIEFYVSLNNGANTFTLAIPCSVQQQIQL